MLVIQTYHSVEICLRFDGSFFISDPMPVSSCTPVSYTHLDLTEVVNAWLQEHADIRLMDIKFSTAVSDFEEEQIYCFSAMVIFST